MPGEHVSARWAEWRAQVDLDEYATRWHRLEAAGQAPHGEADLVERWLADAPERSVLDAGCGTGRVAIELARRGIDVVGVDLDDDLLAYARADGPSIEWVSADLATMQLGRRFGVVVMVGNVLLFCRPEDRGAIVATCAEHLLAGGLLMAGFAVERVPGALDRDAYDQLAAAAGLEAVVRYSTWEGWADDGDGAYVVMVHRRTQGV